MMDGDYKIAYDFCDISIAVQDKGLMVPVVRNAELNFPWRRS
jgi:2-oxoglutarate dehydrogenase E2 component (dihydrolipoamide succinyltransferase)